MTDDGILVESAGAGHWAWVALRLTPAADARYPEADAELAATEHAWLAAQWTTEHGARWEIRYTNNGPQRPLSCVLLGRVHGRDRPVVLAAAAALRDRLGRTPRHVRAEAIMTAEEVRAVLTPARTDHVELRKRLAWAWSARRDTNRSVCFAVSPLVANDRPWTAVRDELARLPVRTTVGVYLEPYQPGDALADHLRHLAIEYAELATEGKSSPMWNVSPPADPFAVTAAPGYRDAVRRYAGRCYRLRVSVTADGPVAPGFAELVAGTIGDAVACRVAPADQQDAWRNVGTLDRLWLDETYRQGAPPGALSDAERILCDLADPGEAGAAFRFPLPAIAGGLEEGQPVAAPVPGRQAVARKRVFVSYVREDLTLVDKLVQSLRDAGHDVWIDRSELLPSRRWKSEIKRAIDDSDYFVACFSPHYWKLQTYMNEELIYAVERMRLMPRDRPWFIPAMLAESEIPDFPIGPNETLTDTLQYADFGKDWDAALRQVLALLGPPAA